MRVLRYYLINNPIYSCHFNMEPYIILSVYYNDTLFILVCHFL